MDRPRIAILGAGISGLASAHFSVNHSSCPRVTVFESSDRVGGLLRTDKVSDFLIETTADSFLVNKQLPWAGRLADEVNFDNLITPEAANRRALILRQGNTYPVPEGFYLMAATSFPGIWESPVLSWMAKLRLRMESWVPVGSMLEQDVSLADFARRRVGRETYERLVQPLVSGIYTADPERLSMRAALPQFVDMLAKHGSLSAGLRDRSEGATPTTAGARYQLFRAPREGMSSFTADVGQSLTNHPTNPCTIRTQAPVAELSHKDGWTITTESGEQSSFDHVIVATPAPTAAQLLNNPLPELAEELEQIEHAGVAVVALGYRREQVRHAIDAFGLVVPEIEGRDIIAISFGSNKFPGRAPDGHVLLRVFLGGAKRRDLLDRDEEWIIKRAIKETSEVLSIEDEPELQRLYRWNKVTPQYHVGHCARLERIEKLVASTTGLALAGNAFRGIGIPQCIRSGYNAVEQLLGPSRTES